MNSRGRTKQRSSTDILVRDQTKTTHAHTSIDSVGRRVKNSVPRNKDIVDLHSFGWRHSLEARHNDWVEAKRFIDACLEVLELGHRKMVRLFIIGLVFVDLCLQLLQDVGVKSKLV